MQDIHPVIAQFQAHAEALDASGRNLGLDDAITKLAAWIGLCQDQLTDDDMAVLLEVGGILYRDGLARRMGEG